IIPINGMLFEHWLYVPMVGFFIMLFAIFRVIFFRIPKRILISFSIVISILYIFLTIHQNNIWSDPITFYRYTLFFAPESARLHNNLAMSYADVGKNQEALAEYTEALALGQNYPEIYNNIGNIYRAMGKYDLAEQYLLDAIKLSPHFAIAKENLIKVYLLSNQYDKALKLSGTSSQIKQLIQELQSQ
ncbi:MAG: tetratricopeptide repeat protein, partial [Candidatus Levyibacteriota bacterium]